MIDSQLAMLALRNRALELVVAEVDYDAATSTADTYASSNQSSYYQLAVGSNPSAGYQSIQLLYNIQVTSLSFYLVQDGAPTGSAYAKVYAATGSHGSTAKPTGAALATSAAVNVATGVDPITPALVAFTFATPLVLTAGTVYCITCEFDGGGGGDTLRMGVDITSPTHAGNSGTRDGVGTWSESASIDAVFVLTGYVFPNLSATSTGYARSSGSFVTDGYRVGMEVLGAGFSTGVNNGAGVITGVSALALTILGGCTVEAAATGRTLNVGVPVKRAWENVALRPVTGQAYVEESYVPATSRLWTFRAQGGQVEETGLYVIRWYGLSGYGPDGLRTCVDTLKALFSPGTSFTLSDGSTVRVRADIGPWAGEIRRLDGGWAVCTLTIPWLARSTNVIAA